MSAGVGAMGPDGRCTLCLSTEAGHAVFGCYPLEAAKRVAARKAPEPKPPRMAHMSKSPRACIYCDRAVGRGGVTINRLDGGDDHAHSKCHAKACAE